VAPTKVAIVTGASSGIGLAIACELARRHYAVVLAARGTDPLEAAAESCRRAGGQAITWPTDVSDPRQVESLVKGACDKFGRVDVMVNNAGYGVYAKALETTDDQMREIMDVNFFGMFYGCKAAGRVMIRQGSGHIFNVSSIVGKRGTPFDGAYCATKFAMCGLTDSLRVEMMPHNVRVTAVCPGLTDTNFSRKVKPYQTKKKTNFKMLHRMQRPEVVAKKVARSIGKNVPELTFTLGGKFLVFL